eukprot:2274556-Lingulodinium_polyedra.AAC.1
MMMTMRRRRRRTTMMRTRRRRMTTATMMTVIIMSAKETPPFPTHSRTSSSPSCCALHRMSRELPRALMMPSRLASAVHSICYEV